jgi:hypothetical protein
LAYDGGLIDEIGSSQTARDGNSLATPACPIAPPAVTPPALSGLVFGPIHDSADRLQAHSHHQAARPATSFMPCPCCVDCVSFPNASISWLVATHFADTNADPDLNEVIR